MPRAIWNGAVIAESDQCEVLDDNQYFPADAVKREYLTDSETHTFCPYKGTASYYTLVVDGKSNPDAAWYYPDTIVDTAKRIEQYVAFWKGVTVEV